MGVRAVQAGALTGAFDRDVPDGSRDRADFDRAAGFRRLAAALGRSPAYLAHRYALSIPSVGTVVLGVKNRAELAECVEAAEDGPLDPELMAEIDAAAGGR
jgi:aryl-alcohol dehydrogenase-like predicted oxidoreductase